MDLLEHPARPDRAEVNEIDARVGRALGRARRTAGLSTAGIAAAAGMAPLALAMCEAGRRRLRAAEALALTGVLGLRAADLYAPD